MMKTYPKGDRPDDGIAVVRANTGRDEEDDAEQGRRQHDEPFFRHAEGQTDADAIVHAGVAVPVVHVPNFRNDGQDRQDGHDAGNDKTHEDDRQPRAHVHFREATLSRIVALEQKDAAQYKGNDQANHDAGEIVRGAAPIDLAQPGVDLFPSMPRRRRKARFKYYVSGGLHGGLAIINVFQELRIHGRCAINIGEVGLVVVVLLYRLPLRHDPEHPSGGILAQTDRLGSTARFEISNHVLAARGRRPGRQSLTRASRPVCIWCSYAF
jgi:hypothetical protein